MLFFMFFVCFTLTCKQMMWWSYFTASSLLIFTLTTWTPYLLIKCQILVFTWHRLSALTLPLVWQIWTAAKIKPSAHQFGSANQLNDTYKWRGMVWYLPPILTLYACIHHAYIYFSSCIFLLCRLFFFPQYIQTVIDLCKSKMSYVCGCMFVDSEGGELSRTWSIYLLDWSIYLVCGPLAPPSRRSLLCLFFGKNKT